MLRNIWICLVNHFPHTDTFGHLCSWWLLKKTLWQKEKFFITINFSFSHHVFNSIQLDTIILQSFIEIFHIFVSIFSVFLSRYFPSLLLLNCCMWESVKIISNVRSADCRYCFRLSDNVNPFPHTTNLQQTILNIFCQEIENLYKSGKHCGKRKKCLFWAISSFVTMF